MDKLPVTMFWMAKALEQALDEGVEHWAADTDKRTKWLNEDPDAWHSIAGTMMVGCYSYAESKLGREWWKTMKSDAARRDLQIHWIVRNAFVHEDSIPKNLKSINDAKMKDLTTYCTQLKAGEILDDKGNVYPCHMEFHGDRLIMNKEAISLTYSIFNCAYRSSLKQAEDENKG